MSELTLRRMGGWPSRLRSVTADGDASLERPAERAAALAAPIGIFDSGVGGLTVARAILDQLPNEQVIYLADTAHMPYGPKPIADVRAYALRCLDELVE